MNNYQERNQLSEVGHLKLPDNLGIDQRVVQVYLKLVTQHLDFQVNLNNQDIWILKAQI